MKKRNLLITAIAVAILAVFAACNGKQGTNDKMITYEDTVGYAQFRAWKTMNDQMAFAENFMTPTVAKKSSPKTTTGKSGSMSSASTQNAKTEKKGWSKAAKYGTIGGGGGAILGAVINKRNRVLGAVLGGVLGGGTGFLIGRSQDKKDGRY